MHVEKIEHITKDQEKGTILHLTNTIKHSCVQLKLNLLPVVVHQPIICTTKKILKQAWYMIKLYKIK